MNDRLNIILSPHFDDAVFSLGGLIATAPERAVVITVFAGTPAEGIVGHWDRRSGFKSAAEAMRARTLENEAALAVLKVAPSAIVNLDFLDGQYHPDKAPAVGLRAAIAETVRRIGLGDGGPAKLFVPASAWHPDHLLVTDSVIELWEAHELPGADIFLYQDQPYAYLELRQRTLAPLRFAKFTTASSLRGVAVQPHWLEFDEAAAVRKQQAAKQYKSQFPIVRPLLIKMIEKFSRYQARAAGLSSPHAELTYRLGAPPHS